MKNEGINMIVIKLIQQLKCVLKKIVLKILFRKKLKMGDNLKFRKNFSIVIENNGEIIIGKNVFFTIIAQLTLWKESLLRTTVFLENV